MTKCEGNRDESNQVEFMLSYSWNKSLWDGKKAFRGLAKFLNNQRLRCVAVLRNQHPASQSLLKINKIVWDDYSKRYELANGNYLAEQMTSLRLNSQL